MNKIPGGINENTTVKKVTPYINAASDKLEERKQLFNKAVQFIDCL